MVTVNEHELLRIWELGQPRHPIDRALLLCAWSRPDRLPESLAHLPLGTVNIDLLRRRADLFGRKLELQVPCGQCGETLELPLDVGELLAQFEGQEMPENIWVDGRHFRLPTNMDLAAIANSLDMEEAALHLLERCCLQSVNDAAITAEVAVMADTELEKADPMADPRLAAACPECGKTIEAVFDPATLLWDEIQAYGKELLRQVHTLAVAYGWTEQEVLALAPRRRKEYLAMVEEESAVMKRGRR